MRINCVQYIIFTVNASILSKYQKSFKGINHKCNFLLKLSKGLKICHFERQHVAADVAKIRRRNSDISDCFECEGCTKDVQEKGVFETELLNGTGITDSVLDIYFSSEFKIEWKIVLARDSCLKRGSSHFCSFRVKNDRHDLKYFSWWPKL